MVRDKAERVQQHQTVAEELEAGKTALDLMGKEMKELHSAIFDVEAQLQARREQQRLAREKIEDQLFGLNKERDIIQAQREVDLAFVEKKAAELNAQWNQRIELEIAAMDQEMAKIKQQIDTEMMTNAKQEQEWENQMRAKREAIAKAKKEAAQNRVMQEQQQHKRAQQELQKTRTKDVPTDLEPVAHGATRHLFGDDNDDTSHEQGDGPSKKKKKSKSTKHDGDLSSSNVTPTAVPLVAAPAPAAPTVVRSKSVVAKIIETATGLLSGRSASTTTTATKESGSISDPKPSPVPFQLTSTSPELHPSIPRSVQTFAKRSIREEVETSSEFQLTPVSSRSKPKKSGTVRVKTPDWVNDHGAKIDGDDGLVSRIARQQSDTKSTKEQPGNARAAAAVAVTQRGGSFTTPAPIVAAYGRKNSLQPVMTYSRTKTIGDSTQANQHHDDNLFKSSKLNQAAKAQGKVVVVTHNQKDRHKPQKKSKKTGSEDDDHSSASQFDLFG